MTVTSVMVEHITLLYINNDDFSEKVDALKKAINGLATIPTYLAVAPVVPHTFPEGVEWTHIVHGRYQSIAHLKGIDGIGCKLDEGGAGLQSTGNAHVMLDFTWPDLGPLNPGQVARVTSFKLKEGVADEINKQILEGLSKINGHFEATYGEEASVFDKANGFSVVAMAVFADSKGLEESGGTYEEAMKALENQFKDAIDEFISLDYVVPYEDDV